MKMDNYVNGNSKRIGSSVSIQSNDDVIMSGIYVDSDDAVIKAKRHASNTKKVAGTTSAAAVASTIDAKGITRNVSSVTLVIDTRERENSIMQAFSIDNKVTCTVESLPIGDFLWHGYIQNNDNPMILDCIIERKTCADFLSSIKDGRYNEQKNRLVNSKVRTIIYLVEGISLTAVTTKHGGVTPFMGLRKAICDTMVQYDIRVIRSRGLDHTIHLLQAMHRQVMRRYLTSSNHLSYIPSQTFIQRATKRPPNRVGQMFSHMMLQVPGCASSAVIAITTEYKSFYELFQYFNDESDDSKAKISKIANICRSTGTHKRIGDKVAKSLHLLFTADF